MCWMPFAGKTKAVCFVCRKTFVSYDREYSQSVEQRDIGGLTQRILVRKIVSLPCPQCGQEMWNAGIHFKTPKQSDTRQWAKVRVLAAHGFRYTNVRCCGWHKPGFRPRRLPEVPAFVAAQKNVSQEMVAAQVSVARKAYRSKRGKPNIPGVVRYTL